VKLLFFAEKYKEFLDNYGPAKLQRRKCERFIFTISAATIAFPIMHGFFLFQPVLPENRFLTETFELDIKMEMKMLPVIQIRETIGFLKLNLKVLTQLNDEM